MRSVVFLLLGALLSAGIARAQVVSSRVGASEVAELVPVEGILRNSVTNLHAEGDTLWAGPFLNLTPDGGQTWLLAEADSLQGSRNRVFSLDVEGDVVWAGLGFTSDAGGSSQPAAGGFLVSEDGGRTFTYRPPQLDAPGNTSVQYGVSTLSALDVIVPEQSPPFDIDYDPITGTVWTAAWASGIRQSSDGGRTWQRVVLPPDSLDAIFPDSAYRFRVEPKRGPNGQNNFLGFGVLVDEVGTVWAGTVSGVNRSRLEDIDPASGDRAWRRFAFDGTAGSLTGNWVISIEEQEKPGRNPIWMATWDASEAGQANQAFGVTVTRDGGETFEQTLIGERINDFAFRGDTVYAAGDDGLFISTNDGRTWRSLRDFDLRATPPSLADRVLRPDLRVFAVATSDDAVWAGTSDGLLKSTDGGATWRLFRTEVPLNPATPSDDVPRVDTYAYPNPFSPNVDRFVRIRYEVTSAQNVVVRIFDFGMQLVRELVDASQPNGTREVTWDGTDNGGLRVANGVYFYTVDTSDGTAQGKILVLE